MGGLNFLLYRIDCGFVSIVCLLQRPQTAAKVSRIGDAILRSLSRCCRRIPGSNRICQRHTGVGGLSSISRRKFWIFVNGLDGTSQFLASISDVIVTILRTKSQCVLPAGGGAEAKQFSQGGKIVARDRGLS